MARLSLVGASRVDLDIYAAQILGKASRVKFHLWMGKALLPISSLVGLAMVLAACTNGPEAHLTTTTETPPSTATTTVQSTAPQPGPCEGHVFCVRYDIHPGATWSDGRPVVAADFAHTLEALTDPISGSAVRSGYELITDIEIIDDKTLLVGFSRPFPPWRTLFDMLLPSHFEGDPVTPGAPVTGPFMLDEWVEGEHIVLRRNPMYWPAVDPASGGALGDVEELVFVFPQGVRDQLQGLERGEIDVINPRPLDWMIEELSDMEAVSHQVAPGAFWEHIDFNHDDPLLAQAWVREAIASAIDRERILDETVRLVDPSATGLDSTVWPANSTNYRDNYGHTFDPESAEELLIGHSCERGDDGVYNCQGRRMSFVWATTVGDEYRETIFDLVAGSLEEVGIEVVLDPRTPSELFSTDVFFGGPNVWQMISFSWKTDADPHLANSTYYCSGGAPSGYGALNVNRYCNDEVESLIRSTERIIDYEERAASYNRADAVYLDDLAMIPLFQKPALLAWNGQINGPAVNISSATDLWNVASWSGKQRVVVALESEPDSLDPINPESDSARLVLAAMFHGAYSINPSLQYVETLVTASEPILGDDR